jgi:hypothetical protein
LILEKLERGQYQGQDNFKDLIKDLPLFSNDHISNKIEEKKVDALQQEIETINLDNTSPKEALDFLYKLKESLKDKKRD